jgi:hypothetical protein
VIYQCQSHKDPRLEYDSMNNVALRRVLGDYLILGEAIYKENVVCPGLLLCFRRFVLALSVLHWNFIFFLPLD